MGANYDMLIVPARESDPLLHQVEQYLSNLGLAIAPVRRLATVTIDDDNAILLSPLSNGWSEIVACNSALGVSGPEWFGANPFAGYLSISQNHCVHVWSLDSGFVAGYLLYERGMRRESACVFSKFAKSTDNLMPGIPTPARLGGHALGDLLGERGYDFASDLSMFPNLEHGMAQVVSRFGLESHLVDYYSAVDEREAIAILDGEYVGTSLNKWVAIPFQ